MAQSGRDALRCAQGFKHRRQGAVPFLRARGAPLNRERWISQHATGRYGLSGARLEGTDRENALWTTMRCLPSSDKHAVSYCVRSPRGPLCKHPLWTPSGLYSDPEQEVTSTSTAAFPFSGGEPRRGGELLKFTFILSQIFYAGVTFDTILRTYRDNCLNE